MPVPPFPASRRRAVVVAGLLGLLLGSAACKNKDVPHVEDSSRAAPAAAPKGEPSAPAAPKAEFEVIAESFADIRILRYRVPGFEALPPQQKELVYYLYEAALAGRDIIWDQNYRHNLTIRRVLEAIVRNPPSQRDGDEWRAFMTYVKRVWFSSGIHHHYSNRKIVPEFSPAYFRALMEPLPSTVLPLAEGESKAALIERLEPILFDPTVDGKKVNLDPKDDLIATSATNFYGEGVTQKEVEAYYAARVDPKDPKPISWGLNSQLAKSGGELVERVWKLDGMYGPAIAKIVEWLERAVRVAENDAQRRALELLVKYYRTGDLAVFDEYSIAWVEDTESRVDVVNGFIEVYGDPMGYRGAFESVVSIRDLEATKRIAAISNEAQWFEQNSPIATEYKKENVQGISAKVITVVVESGDAAPSTPIGINLPNANWIRTDHGSKSVNLGNIVAAYEASRKSSGVLQEFAASQDEVAREQRFGSLADALHTDLHEVIGHASGKLKPGVRTPKETLKNYGSVIEEVRADLVALYYVVDPKLLEIGVMDDLEVGRVAYEDYFRNGLLVQLARVDLGESLEEAHMRCRQLISAWAFERAQAEHAIERELREGKTYFIVRDVAALRRHFGEMLREVQRITSEGDLAAAAALVETYGVKVDEAIHREVKARYESLKIAPYAGFIQPRLVPKRVGDAIVDVAVEYPEDFSAQMLEYAEHHSFLP